MNNRDSYKSVFSQLHTSVTINMEDLKSMNKPRYTGKRLAIVIAVICLVTALSAGAYALNLFGLRELVFPSEIMPITTETSTSETPESPDVSLDEEVADLTFLPVTRKISLMGYADSPGYKAIAEWDEFLLGYDTDGELRRAIGNNWPDIENKYFFYYRAYTQEMADKLDEIAEKYDLTLHTESVAYDADELMEVVAGGSFISGDITPMSGYVYEDGTFKLEGVLEEESELTYDFREVLEDDSVLVMFDDDTDGATILYAADDPPDANAILEDFALTGPIVLIPFDDYEEELPSMRNDLTWFTILYCKNDSLTDIGLSIGDINDYTEWQYETVCGVTVSLSQSDYHALITAQLEDAFVTITTAGGSKLSSTELEEFADMIDFTRLK